MTDDYKPKTDLGRMLLRMRQAYIDAGGKLLTADEIDQITMEWIKDDPMFRGCFEICQEGHKDSGDAWNIEW